MHGGGVARPGGISLAVVLSWRSIIVALMLHACSHCVTPCSSFSLAGDSRVHPHSFEHIPTGSVQKQGMNSQLLDSHCLTVTA
jgi:hypothetical protein